MKYNYTNNRNDYLTSNPLLEQIWAFVLWTLKKVNNYTFDLDTCCSQRNIPAKHYYIDGETDGLTADWMKFNYCNPPFNECEKWVKKAVEEQKKGNTTVMLIPARTETMYWQDNILFEGEQPCKGVAVKFLPKKYCFLNPETHRSMGVFKNALAIVIFNGEYYGQIRIFRS